MIRANDTDVLVIAVATFSQLQKLGLQEMWLAFGQGQNLKWISAQLVMIMILLHVHVPYFTLLSLLAHFRCRFLQCITSC